MKKILYLVCVLLVSLAPAQQSDGYRLQERVLNSGGHPRAGVEIGSAGFRLTLSAIGDGLAGNVATSVSYRADAGFCAAYPPPGEVTGLRFTAVDSLTWQVELRAETYELYRARIGDLAATGYGDCLQQELTLPEATDGEPVAPDEGYFYLITAKSRLAEGGTKGFDSFGAERLGTVCP
jgi:hypothetical protein